jgi:hypothetical protein
VSELACQECGLRISGRFAVSRLGMLSPEQQRFAELFLVSRGNIREVEAVMGISYPTVRKRLEEIAGTLGQESVELARETRSRDEILSRIERGELPAKEGVRLLREL